MLACAHNLDKLDALGLVDRCLRGEQSAWDALVERYGRLVYSIARRHRLCDSDADDVFQDVFACLYRHLGKLKDPSRLPAWLITATRRECWRARRGGLRSTGLDGPADGGQETAEEEAVRWERQRMLHEALQRLSGPERRLVTALFLDSTSPDYKTIAARLGRSEGSIGPTRARVLRKLERFLTQRGFNAQVDLDGPRNMTVPAHQIAA